MNSNYIIVLIYFNFTGGTNITKEISELIAGSEALK